MFRKDTNVLSRLGMMNISAFLLVFFMLAAPAAAQNARVQVIHNSPYAAAATVDIYINDALTLDDFNFRDATEYINLAAGVAITIDVTAADAADNSAPVFTKEIAAPGLTEGETYVLVAAGDPLGGDGQPAFDIFINAMGREAADAAGNAEFLVFHGSPDAPTVDVVERTAGTLVDDFSHGEFSDDYISVPAGDYDIDVTLMDQSAVAYSAVAGLAGAADAALVVLASGFLTPAEETDPGFGLLAVFADGTTALLPENTARVQVIHNSPYAAAATVDVYINDELAVDDFNFRTATGFIDLPAGTTAETAPDIVIDITGADAADNSSPVFSKTVNLTFGDTFIVTAAGDPLGGDGQPAFDLFIAGGQEMAATAGNAEFLVFHGSPDAPTVDVVERTAGTLVDDFAHGEYSDGYISVPAGDYDIDVTLMDQSAVAYSAVAGLAGAADAALVVLASGFLTPAEETDPGFGLLAVFADGTTALLPTNTARANIIHNSPYAAASVVDVYVNDALAVDDFAFQSATGFIDLPAGTTEGTATDVKIDITAADAADNSAPVFTATVNLLFGETYIVTAAGDPAGGIPAFNLFINAMAQEAAGDEMNTDVLVFHGAPDAPTVDVTAGGSPRPLVDGFSFGEYQGYLALPTADYVLNVTLDENNDGVVASFLAPLETLELDGAAAVVQASGFLAPATEDDPSFGLIAVVGELVVPLDANTLARAQVIHNSADPGAGSVDIYVNDGLALDDVAFQTATGFIDLPAGEVKLDIAPPTSSDVSESIFTKTVTLNAGETYLVMASGSLAEGAENGFDLFASNGREQSAVAGGVDLNIFHGASDAPAVDAIVPAETPVVLADDLTFGTFTGFLSVDLADYPINLWTGDQSTLVAQYEAPLAALELADESVTVVASGFLAPASEDEAAFGLYAILAAGGEFVPLTIVSDVATEDILDEVPGEFKLHGNYPNPFNPSTTITFDLPAASLVSVDVYDMLGRKVMSLPAETRGSGTSQNIQLDASSLSSGMYLYQVTAEAESATFVSTGRMILIK